MDPNTLLAGIADHLWQSTLFAAAVAIIAFIFRRHSARVRYWLWLAASVKFLVPFAVLVSLGSQIEIFSVADAPHELIGVIDNAAQPFTQPDNTPIVPRRPGAPVPPAPSASRVLLTAITAWVVGSLTLVGVWLLRWRRVAAIARHALRIDEGPVREALRRLEDPARPITLAASTPSMEPGVFGITRPVLLWPSGIETRLTDAHIEAILAHEVAHVRRHDNLAAFLHMVVQTVFWFHPVVWWIGARLVDEREQACDEEVVRQGSTPHVYAESILKTCQYYVESPLVCVAGVTGSDLKKRVELIMRNDNDVALSAATRLLLAGALVSAVALPVAIGVISSPRLAAQIVAPAADSPVFDVASVKISKGDQPMGGRGVPGRFTSHNTPVRRHIRQAYDIHDTQIIGGPDWIGTQGYDVEATTEKRGPDLMRFMMQSLLRDRFKLTFHSEKRDLPIYALVMQREDGRLGPGLRKTPDGECPAPGSPRRGGPQAGPAAGPPPSPFDPNASAPCGSIIFGPGRLLAHGVPIDMLARSLANLPAITTFNRPVANLTKLEGVYDFDFRWTNALGRGGPPPLGGPPAGGASAAALNPGDEPEIFTALQEQLGLKLNPQRATLDVLVIDSIEKPSEN